MNKSIFTKNILNSVIQLKASEYNDSIDETLLEKLKNKIEGKCDSFGYIKPGSTQLIKRSIGELQQGQFNGACSFKITYSVDICNPVEGMLVKCVTRNINKMGIFCEIADLDPSPLSLILAKQHHLRNEKFESVKINDIINVEIIGIKFNYNDSKISCIGRLSQDNMTLEEELENEESNIEIELSTEGTDTEDADDVEDAEGTGADDVEGAEGNGADDAEGTGVDDAEGTGVEVGGTVPEGMVLESDLQAEEADVLENLKLVEGSNLDLNEPEEELNMIDMEGVQDLESVDLISKSKEGELKTELEEVNSDLDELGEEFVGEQLDLEDMSRKNLIPVYNEETFENPEKAPGKEVFELEVLSNPKYKTFSKPRKNSTKYLNYFIYVQLNNMMIKFYLKNGVEPKKVFLNKNHKYYSSLQEYLSKMGKSLKVEEVEGNSYVI